MAKRAAAGTLALAVCLTGGAALASSAQAASGFSFSARVGGADRFETAAIASAKAFTKADTVVVVNYMATVDGLSASYAAGLHSAPILYTKTNELPDVSAAEIARLGAKNIIIVGGTGVVSADLKSSWESNGFSVTRLSGGDRYETAAKVAASGTAAPGKVFVANGNAPADALAVGPIAFAKHYPILLTKSDSVPTATSDELASLGTSTRVVAGGNAVVSDSTYGDLKATKRLYGANRQGTAVEVSKWAIASEGFSNKDAALVGNTDANTADALVAAPLAGKNGVSLLFTQNGTVGTTTGDYLTSISATLTGTGYVFGGTGAISTSIADEATKAAAGVVSAGFVVTAYTSGASSFNYADPVAKKAVKVSFSSTDKFFVGGVSATAGAFAASLGKGDIVAITAPATSGGATTFSLTNKTTADYMSGLVGAFAVPATHTLDIVEPITGVTLNGGVDYAGAYNVFQVDGATVSQTIFESSLSVGDTVSITGTGADVSHVRTIALTSASVSGTVATVGTGAAVTVKTSAGAALGTFTPASGDTFTIDGTSATLAQFTAADVVTAGDQITYSKSGGVQKFALVNAAPASASGIANSTSSATVLHYWSAAGTDSTVTYGSLTTPTYSVDGSVASQAEFIAAVSPGDVITYQAADTGTKTVASLSLTSKPLSGAVSTVNSSAHTLTVLSSDGDVLQSGVDYSNATSVYAGTSAVYSIDGTTKTLAQFDAAVNRIQTGALLGTIQVSINSGVVTYALATSAFTAAPAMVSGVNAGGSATVTITLNKPASAASALAASDFTVTKNGVSATLTGTPSLSGSTLTLTLSAATASTNVVTVTPTAAGSAKIIDIYGTPLAPSTVSITAS